MTPGAGGRPPQLVDGRQDLVDSATMMNKGLELIEAHHLFGLPSERIDIVVHPQSVIHSLVEYVDGSVLAQLGSPDMRIPIAYALAWPERMATPAERLDLARARQARASKRRSDALSRAAAGARRRSSRAARAAIVLNAANEIAVAGFLDRRIGFLDIARLVERSARAQTAAPAPRSIADVLDIDRRRAR